MDIMLGYVCVALVSVLFAILYFPRDWTSNDEQHDVLLQVPPERLISRDELNLYNGEEDSKGLYLAILGQVFDVSKGRKNYGPGGGYHSMAGAAIAEWLVNPPGKPEPLIVQVSIAENTTEMCRCVPEQDTQFPAHPGKDASLAFITGDFTESGLTDDVSSLSPLQVVALYDWLAFYWKNYCPVGRLVGRFYSESGPPTEALLGVQALLAEGLRLKIQSQTEREHFPACNTEWSANRGRVWCSTKSGGVKRTWTGVPRKLFSPGSSHARCVCIEDPLTARNPNLQEYEDCPPYADSCPVVD